MLIFCIASTALSPSKPAISLFSAGFISSNVLASFIVIFATDGLPPDGPSVAFLPCIVFFVVSALGLSLVARGSASVGAGSTALTLLSSPLGTVDLPFCLDSDIGIGRCRMVLAQMSVIEGVRRAQKGSWSTVASVAFNNYYYYSRICHTSSNFFMRGRSTLSSANPAFTFSMNHIYVHGLFHYKL